MAVGFSLSAALAFGAAETRPVNIFAKNRSSYAIDIKFSDAGSVLVQPHDDTRYVGSLKEGETLTYTYRGWLPKTLTWDYLQEKKTANHPDVLITFNQFTGAAISGGYYFNDRLSLDQEAAIIDRLDTLLALVADLKEGKIDAQALQANFNDLFYSDKAKSDNIVVDSAFAEDFNPLESNFEELELIIQHWKDRIQQLNRTWSL